MAPGRRRAGPSRRGKEDFMRLRKLVLFTCLGIGAAVTGVLAQQQPSPPPDNRPATGRYLPEYTKDGDLILPKNYKQWIYVGSPLTPNALNGGEANFPEFHNVYIEPGSYEIYKKTGVFPEGTIFYKELQLLQTADHPDGSSDQPSGRGFFPGKLNGADVTVKDTKRFAASNGWGYFNFNHHEPKAPTAKVRPREECAFCHIQSAKRDDVWTQFYEILDAVPLPANAK
jgi:hypothetical protein